ncbi:MAG: hypothetical protein NT025_00025 [bacterium]|nr:hypothetical protein [bacterium]
MTEEQHRYQPGALTEATPEFRQFCTNIAEAAERGTLNESEIDAFFWYAEDMGINEKTGLREYRLSHNVRVGDEMVTAGVILAGDKDTKSILSGCDFRDTTRYFFYSGYSAAVSCWDGNTDEYHQYVRTVQFPSPGTGWIFCDGSYTVKGKYIGHQYGFGVGCYLGWCSGLPHRFSDYPGFGAQRYCVKAKLEVGASTVMNWTTKEQRGVTSADVLWADGTSFGKGGTTAFSCSLFVAPHLAGVWERMYGYNGWFWQSKGIDDGSDCDDEGLGWEWEPVECDPSGQMSCLGDSAHLRTEWTDQDISHPGQNTSGCGFRARWFYDEDCTPPYETERSQYFRFAADGGSDTYSRTSVTMRYYRVGSCGSEPC